MYIFHKLFDTLLFTSAERGFSHPQNVQGKLWDQWIPGYLAGSKLAGTWS